MKKLAILIAVATVLLTACGGHGGGKSVIPPDTTTHNPPPKPMGFGADSTTSNFSCTVSVDTVKGVLFLRVPEKVSFVLLRWDTRLDSATVTTISSAQLHIGKWGGTEVMSRSLVNMVTTTTANDFQLQGKTLPIPSGEYWIKPTGVNTENGKFQIKSTIYYSVDGVLQHPLFATSQIVTVQ